MSLKSIILRFITLRIYTAPWPATYPCNDISLAAKDGVDGAVAQIVGEFAPLMYKSTGTAGKIFAIVHGHGQSAASMQVRLQNMGTVDGVDLSSATVTARDLDGFVAT